MILVDTSALIDFFKGSKTVAVENLQEILERGVPFGITSVIYQELLQGARDEAEYAKLQEYLQSQRFYHPLHAVESYAEAARIFFTCRRRGVTIRSTIDCLISRIAMEHDLILLHNDRDFEAMATIIPLKLY